ncbi:hypothetical protein BC937DRAFT_92682 [Endogone sp. FLAS-F59071]|nr:hypothetical protein BC937DRAFT_92682 [Endogone sp. FLAS-F59071]|eukprot:RUS15260.1 hypothetical protein BC937DRAFT_92682 [Endogone sp. FLAS-F59071]
MVVEIDGKKRKKRTRRGGDDVFGDIRHAIAIAVPRTAETESLHCTISAMSTSPPPFHHSDSWSSHSRTDSPTPLGSITKHATMTSHPTRCAHTLSQKENSILSLAASDRYLFSGSQDLHIYVGIVRVFLDEFL